MSLVRVLLPAFTFQSSSKQAISRPSSGAGRPDKRASYRSSKSWADCYTSLRRYTFVSLVYWPGFKHIVKLDHRRLLLVYLSELLYPCQRLFRARPAPLSLAGASRVQVLRTISLDWAGRMWCFWSENSSHVAPPGMQQGSLGRSEPMRVTPD